MVTEIAPVQTPPVATAPPAGPGVVDMEAWNATIAAALAAAEAPPARPAPPEVPASVASSPPMMITATAPVETREHVSFEASATAEVPLAGDGPEDVEAAIAAVVESILGPGVPEPAYDTDGIEVLTTTDGRPVLDRLDNERSTEGEPGARAASPEERHRATLVSAFTDQIVAARSPEERAFELEQLALALRRAVGELPPASAAERRALVHARIGFRVGH